MSKPEFSKPFNVLDAKAGAPYCCRNGEEAIILKWDGRRFNEPLVGCIGTDDIPASWGNDGRHVPDEPCPRPRDLVMLPVGMCQSKPVFMGDELVTRFGEKFVVETKHIGDLDEENTWPAPAPAYPVTLMTDGDLVSNYYGGGPVSHEQEYQAWHRIANAALRHAIDAGQVVLPDTAPSDDLLMKVAKEVYCRATGQEHFLNEKEQYFRSIIASVTGAKDAQPIDFGIKKGDMVYSKTWGAGKEPVEVIDINWALKAIAVKLSPTGGTIVWPIEGMTKERFSEDAKEGVK